MKPNLDPATPVKPYLTSLNGAIVSVGVILVALCGFLLFQNQQLKQEPAQVKNPLTNQVISLPSPSTSAVSVMLESRKSEDKLRDSILYTPWILSLQFATSFQNDAGCATYV